MTLALIAKTLVVLAVGFLAASVPVAREFRKDYRISMISLAFSVAWLLPAARPDAAWPETVVSILLVVATLTAGGRSIIRLTKALGERLYRII